MERVIRVTTTTRRRGKPHVSIAYFYGWHRHKIGCNECPSYTKKQTLAKRYEHRSSARDDLARLREDAFEDEKHEIVKLGGLTSEAIRFVRAARAARALLDQKGAPKLARQAALKVGEACAGELAASVDRLTKRRDTRARERRERGYV